MIRLINIHKGFMTLKHGWKQVLNGITIDIRDDQNLGILGKNGAGKSTLMRIMSGLDLPDKGTLDSGGRSISWPLGSSAGVHGGLTGKENLRFICRIYNKDIKTVTEFVDGYAELGKYLDMPVNTYSSGMKSRLGFGISMAMDFDTYLIDEGFSAGDKRFMKKTEELFAEKTKKANMIVVSHSVSTIKKFCNSAVILKDGQLQYFGDINDAINEYDNLW